MQNKRYKRKARKIKGTCKNIPSQCLIHCEYYRECRVEKIFSFIPEFMDLREIEKIYKGRSCND